ncbi:MAG: hypothetical protein PW734_02270 [Verrucomicrobium sp.]|nr:hypothetical protein [Verrucomicrobium sp.]
MKTLKAALCALVTVALVACGGGSPLTLTQANLDKIHDDMTPAEVKAILGSPTDSKSEPIPVVGGTQTTYVYRNDKSEAKIIFKNDQVKGKEGSFSN